VFAYLSKAIELGLNHRRLPKNDPAFSDLRNHPDFQRLLALEPRQLAPENPDPIYVDPFPSVIE